jgi:hydroxymethylpyrimidine/phosphomethylpyrimidine kinase
MIPVALTIAGSDPSGGAGIQADLKTFHQLQVYGAAAISLITVQNTRGVSRVETLDPALISEQVAAVLEDLPTRAIKTGALGSAAIIESIARTLERKSRGCPLVIDPVMISTSGALLAENSAVSALERFLLPMATLITPNLEEATRLSDLSVKTPDQMRQAATRIAGAAGREDTLSVLIKGGHLENEDALDILFHRGVFTEFRSCRISTGHTHGTGCTYSAAITALLARGFDLPEAVRRAKRFIDEAIRTNPGLGSGAGPLNHWAVSGIDPG